jgi:hypothetical protein
VGFATAATSLLRYAVDDRVGWGDHLVTIRTLLLLGGVSLASVASAQSPAANSSPPPALEAPATVPASPPAPPPPSATAPRPATMPTTASNPGLPPQRVHAIVRAAGFDPVGPPTRRGNLYVQRALDPNAVAYRVVVDSLTGRTLSVRPMRIAGPYAYGPPPYRAYPPPYRGAYGRYYGPPPDDFGYGYGAPHPPRNIPTARLAPPQSPPPTAQPPSHQPPPSTTAQAPLPRPKPYVMESTGSIPIDSPKPLAAQKTPEPKTAAAPAAAPQSNGAAALPPVAPLD